MTKLTIGMATFDDFDGVYFTVQSLRLHHAAAMKQCEIVVVDNNPSSKHGEMTKNLCERVGAKYVQFPEPVGTTQPRNEVFRQSTGDAVACVDGHVLFPPGAIQNLIDYFDSHPDSRDLLSGPIIMDSLTSGNTHFADVWRSEMWGIWATAWDCKCGGSYFQVLEGEGGQAKFTRVVPDHSPFSCPKCASAPPPVAFAGHEPRLSGKGYKQKLAGDPFEIPGMGLGMFACRRESWLGFNDKFRGFGGEEMYIHEKFRRAGAKCLCLPSVPWVHRFGRPSGAPYPNTRWNKIRNYVLGHTELGLPLDAVRAHFLDGNLIPKQEWESLVENPSRELPVAAGGCNTGCSGARDDLTLDQKFDVFASSASDINEHCAKLRELASQSERVVDFGMRPASTVALLAGRPKRMVSYAQGAASFKRVSNGTDFTTKKGDSLTADVEESDLLFIDTKHTGAQFYAELTRLAPGVKRWIVRHDTQVYGEIGEDRTPGLLHGMRRFLKEQPEWSVIYHSAANNGLTVLSRNPDDRPKTPGIVTKAANFARALAAHVADGGAKVSAELMSARMDTCMTCDQRGGPDASHCAACGCYLPEKTSWRSADCPLGRWPSLPVISGEAAK